MFRGNADVQGYDLLTINDVFYLLLKKFYMIISLYLYIINLRDIQMKGLARWIVCCWEWPLSLQTFVVVGNFELSSYELMQQRGSLRGWRSLFISQVWILFPLVLSPFCNLYNWVTPCRWHLSWWLFSFIKVKKGSSYIMKITWGVFETTSYTRSIDHVFTLSFRTYTKNNNRSLSYAKFPII